MFEVWKVIIRPEALIIIMGRGWYNTVRNRCVACAISFECRARTSHMQPIVRYVRAQSVTATNDDDEQLHTTTVQSQTRPRKVLVISRLAARETPLPAVLLPHATLFTHNSRRHENECMHYNTRYSSRTRLHSAIIIVISRIFYSRQFRQLEVKTWPYFSAHNFFFGIEYFKIAGELIAPRELLNEFHKEFSMCLFGGVIIGQFGLSNSYVYVRYIFKRYIRQL